MKNNLCKKRSVGLSLLTLLPGMLLAQTDVTKELTQSGALGTLLTNEEKANVENLTLTTAEGVTMNAEDFKVLNALPKLKTLDLSGDLNTTALPDSAFTNNQTLESIEFPANMNNLGAAAFNSCNLQGTVTFPDSFTNENNIFGKFRDCQGITAFAFGEGNTGLEAIDGVIFTKNKQWVVRYPCGKEDAVYTLPEGYVKIKNDAFAENHHLKELTLASTTQFDRITDAFGTMYALEKVLVHEDNLLYTSYNGMLVNKLTKTLEYFPVNYPEESVVIDGTQITKVGDGCFSRATKVKRVKMTEGVTTIGNQSFRPANGDGTLSIEYVELPSTVTYLSYAAFYGLCPTIQQFICRATTVPGVDGDIIFRGSNSTGVKFGVPADALATYKASTFGSGGNFFQADAIVAYHTLTYENCSAFHDVSVEGVAIEITADEAPEGKSFARWEAVPAVGSFSNSNATTTLYTMPAQDVTIRAVYEDDRDYTVIGSTGTQSGKAAIGAVVSLETDGEKEGDNGEWLTFREWRVNSGNITIDNPKLISTFFQMTSEADAAEGDKDIEIEAVYGQAYSIDITGGHGPAEAFEGETVEIYADPLDGYVFSNWTTETVGVSLADAASDTTSFVMPASNVAIVANFTESSGVAVVGDEQLTLWPNPATDYVALSGAEAGTTYYIYDLLGMPVMQGVYDGAPIRLGGMSAGSYVLRLGNQTLRFIKR